jgi:hypothetical protein
VKTKAERAARGKAFGGTLEFRQVFARARDHLELVVDAALGTLRVDLRFERRVALGDVDRRLAFDRGRRRGERR